MKNSLILFITIFLPIFKLTAGVRDVGNGGDGVVCASPNGEIQSVELLDFYEARILHRWNLKFGPDDPHDASGVTLALRVVERLTYKHPVTAMFYRKRIQDFFQHTRIKNDINLYEIHDSGVIIQQSNHQEPQRTNHVFIPEGCEIKQLAIRRDTATIPDQLTFSINGKYWDKMDQKQRAGLILHEIVYEDLLLSAQHQPQLGPRNTLDSRHARYIVGFLSAHMITAIPEREYLRILGQYGWFIEDLVFDNLPPLLEAMNNGSRQINLQQDELIEVGQYQFKALRGSIFRKPNNHLPGLSGLGSIVLAENTRVQNESGHFEIAAGSEIQFLENGKIFSAFLTGRSQFRTPTGLLFQVRGNPFYPGVPAQERTDFFSSPFPRRFFVSPNDAAFKSGPWRLLDLGVFWTSASFGPRRLLDLGVFVDCPLNATDFCIELHSNGQIAKIYLNAEPGSGELWLQTEEDGEISLRNLYRQAVQSTRFQGQPKKRLPTFLEFNELGQAKCPYRNPETRRCEWLEIVN